MLFEIKNLTVSFDRAMILNNISLHVDQGELVGVVGPNGAGKSTLLRTVSGLVLREKALKRGVAGGEITINGEVIFKGEPINKLPAHEIVKRGLSLCPERRRPFREMSVLENFMAGAYLEKDQAVIEKNLENVFHLFPVLKQRLKQVSGTMSGGEQQMLAIGRALMGRPELLCIDEPSTGLAPILRQEVFDKVKEINETGVTCLLVEQEVSSVFTMAHRNYVLSSGKIIAQGSGDELLSDDNLRQTYLGL